MGKESNCEIYLWDWLINKNNNISKIFFNRKNMINAPIFHTKENNKKPDFIVQTSYGYIAIEIKDGDISKDISDAGKIIEYLKNYLNKETIYFIENKEIKIEHFVIATKYSPFGHLFKDEIKLMNNKIESTNEFFKKYIGTILPYYEYQRTRDFLRYSLWSRFRLERSSNWKEEWEKPSIGILLSDSINKIEPEYTIGKPMILTMAYKTWNNKGKWKQSLLYL